MYETFFGLKDRPFQLSPDPSFFYASKTHSKGLAYLHYGIKKGEGFVVVTGIPGTGKTTLLNTLISELPKERFLVVKLSNTLLTTLDMLHAISRLFGLNTNANSKVELLHELERHLLQQARMGKYVLLLIDEAHNLTVELLEELRLLSNFQFHDNYYMQIFLLGQQQLEDTLNLPEMMQLRQRVLVSHHLQPINRNEIGEYIEHRLKASGWTGTPEFTREALILMHHYAEGIPRQINTLADRVMLFAYLEEQHVINRDTIESVIDELKLEPASYVQGRTFPEIELNDNQEVTRNQQEFDFDKKPRDLDVVATSQALKTAFNDVEEERETVATNIVAWPPASSRIDAPSMAPSIKASVHTFSGNNGLAEELNNHYISAEEPVVDIDVAEEKKQFESGSQFEDSEVVEDSTAEGMQNKPTVFDRRVLFIGLCSVVLLLVVMGTWDDGVPVEPQEKTANESTVSFDLDPQVAVSDTLDSVDANEDVVVEVEPTIVETETEMQDQPFENEYALENVAPTKPVEVVLAEKVKKPKPWQNIVEQKVEFSHFEKKAENLSTPGPQVEEALKPPGEIERVDLVPKKPKKALAGVSKQIVPSDVIAEVAMVVPKKTSAVQEKSTVVVVPVDAETAIEENGLQQSAIDDLLRRFRDSYQTGDVGIFSSIFSSNVKSNDLEGREDLMNEYTRLFDFTDERYIDISQLSWERENNTTQGKGGFKISVREKGANKAIEYSGNIDIVIEGSEKGAKITKIYYSYND